LDPVRAAFINTVSFKKLFLSNYTASLGAPRRNVCRRASWRITRIYAIALLRMNAALYLVVEALEALTIVPASPSSWSAASIVRPGRQSKAMKFTLATVKVVIAQGQW